MNLYYEQFEVVDARQLDDGDMMLFWRMPATTTAGRRAHHGRHTWRQVRADQAFEVCRLNKHHVVSLAVGLGLVTLLLVIFAYHGSYGIGSWFYSLLVVVSGLAFVVFGPLLVCRFLMHAYYRQLESRALRLQVPSVQSQSAATVSPTPHVYACIIIAPEDNSTICGADSQTAGLSDLPTYEEATTCGYSPTDMKSTVIKNGACSSMAASKTARNGSDGANSTKVLATKQRDAEKGLQEEQGWQLSRFKLKDESPPPSYTEALAKLVEQQQAKRAQRAAKDGKPEENSASVPENAPTPDETPSRVHNEVADVSISNLE